MAVDPNIKKKANDIRSKIYGNEVRESLASGIEEMSEDVVENTGRQDSVEERFQNVLESTTDKDVISAPEIIDARNGKNNLKQRLDDEHQEVTAQLAQKAYEQDLETERTRINNLIANAGDTDGNAELLDIRVGTDGTVYETAGEAVRNVLTPFMTTTDEGWEI